jgi:hypothetical protein
MKNDPFSTLTGGHIMKAVEVLEKVNMLLHPGSVIDLAALREEARKASTLLRVHSGLESLRIEVREEA